MSIKLWRHFDPVLVAASLLLTAIGVVMVYAALSSPTAHAAALTATLHEASYAMLGVLLLVAVCFLDYHVFRTLFWPLFIGNALLLLAVLAAGRASHGAQRWLSLGFFPFQPSELGKLMLILTLAKILADRDQQITKLRIVLLTLLIAAIPAALVYPQPDLGTAVVYLAIWLGMTMAAGMRVRHLALLAVACAAATPFALKLLRGYMLQRLTIFLHPESDPTGAGYNIIQALIAIGNGGWIGQGFLKGTQSQLSFLRVGQSDFIFSAIAEQLGFLGCLLLFGLFALLLTRLLDTAGLAQDLYGRLVTVGIMWMLLFQMFVNVGMNLQLMPVTGIPLPFISAGGSSLVTSLLAIGIVQSIRMRQKKIVF